MLEEQYFMLEGVTVKIENEQVIKNVFNDFLSLMFLRPHLYLIPAYQKGNKLCL
jgi:hypothetical protein